VGLGAAVDFDHHDPAFLEDPSPTYLGLQAASPVVRSPHYGGFWFLHRAEDVRAVAKDWRRFSSAVPDVTAIPSSHPREEPDLPIEIDPPQHTRYRQLVSPVFTRHRVEEMRPGVQAIASSLLDNLLREGRGNLVSDFAIPLSVGTLALLIGIPGTDSDRWVGWVRRMYDSADAAERKQAADEYFAYIDALVASRRPDDAGDFASRLLASEVEGERLSPGEVARFLRLLLIAGHETTASAMSWTLHWLAEHPEERRRLAGNPHLIPTAVDEFLRLASPVVLSARNATTDLELHGVSIGEGDVVALGFAAANLDADAFPNPTRCVLDRADNRHLAFGFGPHVCLGAHVARLELTVMLEEVGRRVEQLRVSAPTRRNPSGSVRSFAVLPVQIS
jgi:cytochrome P450